MKSFSRALNFFDIVRLVGYFCVAVLLTFLVPEISFLIPSGFIVYELLFFTFIVGFLINRALERKRDISASVASELVHLRHLAHVSESLGSVSWRKKFNKALFDYHEQVSKTIESYEDRAEKRFHEVSHAVYAFSPADDRETVMFADMMETTNKIALERRNTLHQLRSSLPAYHWVVMLTFALFVIGALLGSRTPGDYLHGVVVTITSIFITLDLLAVTNHMSRVEIKNLQNRYSSNLPKN
ncbi:MAG: hypothetical protein WCJ29_04545 [bacterium]